MENKVGTTLENKVSTTLENKVSTKRSRSDLIGPLPQIIQPGPLTQTFLDYDDECYGELSQAFDEASQEFRRLPLYYQIGSGFENRPGPASETNISRENVQGPSNVGEDEFDDSFNPDGDLENAIVFEEVSRRLNRKYKAEEIRMRALMNLDLLPENLRNLPLYSTIHSVRLLFQIILERSIRNLRPTDLIRIFIQSDGLDRPISTGIMRVSEMTVEKILSEVTKVLQSKDEIKLDEGFDIQVITFRLDAGAGGFRGVTNIAIDRLRKKSILSVPEDDQGLCCAKAILYALAHLENDRTAISALENRRRPALIKRAKKLHADADVPLGPCTYIEVAKFEAFLDVQIVVISSEKMNKVTYKGPARQRRINLWLHDHHYDAIKSLKGFYGRHNYCQACERPFDRIEDHRCADACYVCHAINCLPEESIRCSDCERLCRSRACYDRHKATSSNQQNSICDRVYQCRACSKVIRRRDCPRELHRCNNVRCPSCTLMVESETHRCFLKKVAPKPPSDLFIYFDFETSQESGEHIVNFAVAQYGDGREKIFKGYNACEEFCSWLFTADHKGFTAIAHNMKGFDGQFVLSWLLHQGNAPEVIPNGSKLMAISLKSLDIRMIDSYCFLPMALAKLPACFGLTELKKGFFPHLFNTRDNQSYRGCMPDSRYYSPDSMSKSAREAFFEWYKDHEGDIFDFQEEMLQYCRSDVDILRRCCLEFRTQWLEITKVDPFCYVTIASACMAVYRSLFIQDNTIGMVPVHGYINNTNYSADGIRWLDFLAENRIFIQHALNGNGEVKVHGMSVDGFHEESKTIYQYHGCFFHGCENCFNRDVVNPLKGVTMGSLFEKTATISNKFRALGYKVIEKWEHEFSKEKKMDEDLKRFLTQHKCQDRLNPRDAFFGGRTNAVRLFFEGIAKYVDFTSLYPWVNKYCEYPVGHPKIITSGFSAIDNYFGVIKCKVLPPSKLYLPVLPVKLNGKLMFPLCYTCAESMQQTECGHSHEQRSVVGTWITEEVKVALSKGYQILEIFEVYHFDQTSKDLFRPYIDLFLKIKQESSGWPSNCTTEEARKKYLKEYAEREGIALDPTAISKNPGRRQVAKLALNSFWGRWGMNCNKTQLQYVDSLESFNRAISDSTKKIKDIYLPTPEVAAVQWEREKKFITQDTSTNVFLAAFTTSWARIKLYEEMDKLDRDVLYHDTDSIIYVSSGDNDPPLGNYLGDFTDELDGETITSFVSGGAKNYAYSTSGGKTCCKIRGFTLNFKNSELLNYASMKHLVKSWSEGITITVENDSKIVRDGKRRKVLNKHEKKVYKIVYDKRVIQNDFSTLPYGY